MLNEFNNHSLISHFIEDYDRENLLDEDLKIFHPTFVSCRPGVDGQCGISQCAITLAHIQAYRNIINNQYKYSLILEDDVISLVILLSSSLIFLLKLLLIIFFEPSIPIS